VSDPARGPGDGDLYWFGHGYSPWTDLSDRAFVGQLPDPARQANVTSTRARFPAKLAGIPVRPESVFSYLRFLLRLTRMAFAVPPSTATLWLAWWLLSAPSIVPRPKR
jgi:hypothetical protein